MILLLDLVAPVRGLDVPGDPCDRAVGVEHQRRQWLPAGPSSGP